MSELTLNGRFTYYVFPPYGQRFRNMSLWQRTWDDYLRDHPGHLRFWPGFSGGGVLGILSELTVKTHEQVALECDGKSAWRSPLFGLSLGNQSGHALSDRVLCMNVEVPPPIAVRLGLATRVREPRVIVTVEHIESIVGSRVLLVVPKQKRKTIRLTERLPEWFKTFGVTVGLQSMSILESLRPQMV